MDRLDAMRAFTAVAGLGGFAPATRAHFRVRPVGGA